MHPAPQNKKLYAACQRIAAKLTERGIPLPQTYQDLRPNMEVSDGLWTLTLAELVAAALDGPPAEQKSE